MNSNLLLIALIVFVALTTVAMIVQAVAMLGIARVVRQMHDKLNAFLPEAARVLDSAQKAIDQTSKFLTETNARTTSILDLTKAQLEKLDAVVSSAASRAQAQMERAELVIDDAMSRTQQTVASVQKGIISPIREVHGLMMGVRTTIIALARGRRPTVDHVTADEEMFI